MQSLNKNHGECTYETSVDLKQNNDITSSVFRSSISLSPTTNGIKKNTLFVKLGKKNSYRVKNHVKTFPLQSKSLVVCKIAFKNPFSLQNCP